MHNLLHKSFMTSFFCPKCNISFFPLILKLRLFNSPEPFSFFCLSCFPYMPLQGVQRKQTDVFLARRNYVEQKTFRWSYFMLCLSLKFSIVVTRHSLLFSRFLKLGNILTKSVLNFFPDITYKTKLMPWLVNCILYATL